MHPTVLTANIKKAYLQISIDEDQGDYLRFLWQQNLREESIIKKCLQELFMVLRHLNSY